MSDMKKKPYKNVDKRSSKPMAPKKGAEAVHVKGKKETFKKEAPKKDNTKKPCPAMGKCGGCQYLNLTYPEQLAKKQEYLKKTCGSLVKFDPIIGMKQPKHYRNKVHAAYGEDRKHHHNLSCHKSCTHHYITEQTIACVLIVWSDLKRFQQVSDRYNNLICCLIL